MKKAKIALSAVAVLSVLGTTFAFKAIKRFTGGRTIYYTTSYNATATKTITHAVVDVDGAKLYYTFADNSRALFYSTFLKVQ